MFCKMQNTGTLYQSLSSCKRTKNDCLFHLHFQNHKKKIIFRIATSYRHYHFNEHQYHSKSHRLYISGTNEITSECGRPHRSSWFRFSISSLDCHLQSYSILRKTLCLRKYKVKYDCTCVQTSKLEVIAYLR